ncbi:hypothetical protein FOFC_07614 [Fusarium oxysporum]|nr:hypothetical protein FOFC_07614 [Fusarium oxysporum]
MSWGDSKFDAWVIILGITHPRSSFLLARSKVALRAAHNAAGNDAGAQSIETFSTALNKNTPSGPDTTVDHVSEENGWEGINALQKLHHLAVWIGSSPIHSDNWREAVGCSHGIDNATRWSSWYKVISVALDKKAQIVQFMLFTEATLITEGDKASLCSTQRLMDGLLSHFEKAKIHYSNPEFHDSRMLHSIDMGWFVLDKYYIMSDEAPVYVAALLLDPRCRTEKEEYNTNIDGDIETTPEGIPTALGKPPSQLQLLLQEMEVETALSTDGDNLDAFINSPAIKIDCKPLEWWCHTWAL